jgi:ATP-dependent helicase/nuclease subunit A
MTIHGSKGLEFGHVFVAGCGRRLAAGHKEKLLFSERDGLGPLYVDLARSVTKHTYVRLAMERSLRNADLAEEMRLLYVAMTRAARSLVLVAGIPLDPDKGVPALARRIRDARMSGGTTRPLPSHLSLAAGSFLDWILLSMARDVQVDWTPIAGAADPEGLMQTEPARSRMYR